MAFLQRLLEDLEAASIVAFPLVNPAPLNCSWGNPRASKGGHHQAPGISTSRVIHAAGTPTIVLQACQVLFHNGFRLQASAYHKGDCSYSCDAGICLLQMRHLGTAFGAGRMASLNR